jgi:hypothetical protein
MVREEILPLVERASPGVASVWDGVDYVAEYNDVAMDAMMEVDAIMQRRNLGLRLVDGDYRDAREWLRSTARELPVLATSSVDELAALTEHLVTEAASKRVVIDRRLTLEFLVDPRWKCRSDGYHR